MSGCLSIIVGASAVALGSAVGGPAGAAVGALAWIVMGTLQHQQRQIEALREKAEDAEDDDD